MTKTVFIVQTACPHGSGRWHDVEHGEYRSCQEALQRKHNMKNLVLRAEGPIRILKRTVTEEVVS